MAAVTIHTVRERHVDPTLIESMEAMIGHMDRLAQEALVQADHEEAERDKAIAAWLKSRGLPRRPSNPA